MNESENAGENCGYLQCGPCRGYPYVGISQNIRSSTSHMYYYIVILKNIAKFTGMYLHYSLFSTSNLQLYQKRDAGTYSFLVVWWNFLWTILLWKTFWKLVLKGELYEKWQTDVLIIIKWYCEVDSSFKKQTLQGKVYFLKYVTKIFGLLLFSGKIWECFKVQLSVVVFILPSTEANQLQVLYVRTLGNIQRKFITKTAVLKSILSNLSGNLERF